MSGTPPEPAAVMAAHAEHRVFYKDQGCTLRPGSYSDGAVVHCEPYRLADALATEQAKVARVETLLDAGPRRRLSRHGVRAALAEQPEQGRHYPLDARDCYVCGHDVGEAARCRAHAAALADQLGVPAVAVYEVALTVRTVQA